MFQCNSNKYKKVKSNQTPTLMINTYKHTYIIHGFKLEQMCKLTLIFSTMAVCLSEEIWKYKKGAVARVLLREILLGPINFTCRVFGFEESCNLGLSIKIQHHPVTLVVLCFRRPSVIKNYILFLLIFVYLKNNF